MEVDSKSCEADATTITISVNDRSEHDITKRFTKLNIDWLVIERQLQAWSHLLRIGKKLRINMLFNYTESSKASCTAGRGATAAALAERNTRIDAEQAHSGGPDAWRHVYNLLRCPGSPCDLGPYCCQDRETYKHYKLLGHYLRTLVKFVQHGDKLESHDDVPQDVRTQL
ncbi:Short chain dehydrogenase reductase family protein [Rutstroemia sp. NJR-2017a WRK4]|nr:Short chain dehydrogenase reductase family protein [Rutstroemia sp. NJR-2017a WRK4]